MSPIGDNLAICPPLATIRPILRMRALAGIASRTIAACLLFAPLLLHAGLSVKPTVNIVAADAYAHEDPVAPISGPPAASRNAVFVVSRTWPTPRTLTVFYEIRGTASNGGDYYPLHGTITIPAGRRSACIVIDPIPDPHPETDTK